MLAGQAPPNVAGRATYPFASSQSGSCAIDEMIPSGLARFADEAEASLGRMGERTTIVLSVADDDGDGVPDVVVGRAVSQPPRVVPSSLGGMVGFEEIRVGVRVRIERVV